jgi:hypothetical protein
MTSSTLTYATPGTITIVSKDTSDFTYSCPDDIISSANCTLKFGANSSPSHSCSITQH